MATSKTLAPTNVTIQIPAMTDTPDASVFSNCVDKEADAINALNSKIKDFVSLGQFSASASAAETKIQDCIDKITTNGKYITFTGIPTSSGANLVYGFIYPNKDYGGGFILSTTNMYSWGLSNGTITVNS